MKLAMVLPVLCILAVPLVAPRATAQRTSPDVLAAAKRDTALRILVSVRARKLWVIAGRADTLRRAPVAVGSGRSVSYSAHKWSFATPRGVRTVVSKEEDPVWIPPDWHYVEVARQEHLELVWLHGDTTIALRGGPTLVLHNGIVQFIDDGEITEFESDEHIIIDDVLYVPPIGSANRRVPGQLGKYRLVLGDGLGIHGTPYTESVGTAATHGCLRLYDADIEWLYEHIPVGTRVYIY